MNQDIFRHRVITALRGINKFQIRNQIQREFDNNRHNFDHIENRIAHDFINRFRLINQPTYTHYILENINYTLNECYDELPIRNIILNHI
jgi:hypothetical protein